MLRRVGIFIVVLGWVLGFGFGLDWAAGMALRGLAI